MNVNDFMTPEQRFEHEHRQHEMRAVQKLRQPQKQHKEYTNQVFCVSSISYIVLLVIAVVMYYVFGEIPTEIVKWTSIVYGGIFISYCGKCAYEGGGR